MVQACPCVPEVEIRRTSVTLPIEVATLLHTRYAHESSWAPISFTSANGSSLTTAMSPGLLIH